MVDFEDGLNALEELITTDRADNDSPLPNGEMANKMSSFHADAAIVRSFLKKEAPSLSEMTAMSLAMSHLRKLGLSLTPPVDIDELVGLIPKGLSGAVKEEMERRRLEPSQNTSPTLLKERNRK